MTTHVAQYLLRKGAELSDLENSAINSEDAQIEYLPDSIKELIYEGSETLDSVGYEDQSQALEKITFIKLRDGSIIEKWDAGETYFYSEENFESLEMEAKTLLLELEELEKESE